VITPTEICQRVEFHPPAPLLKGLDARVDAWIGVCRRRSSVAAQLRRQAEEIDSLAPEWVESRDEQLHRRLMELRDQFRRGGRQIQPLLAPALAGIREAADRKLGLRPFIVQLMGALALHRGFLAEMATGEGKTLTAGLAAVLAGWTKHPCHIVTVNDYLVQRDAAWLEPLYHFCGVRVGHVTANHTQPERVKNYGCDVTYVTSKELLADFLRDRLQIGRLQNPSRRLIRWLLAPHWPKQEGLVLRGLHKAIVDEADSVLIDEAVTPLIISAPGQNEPLREAAQLAHELAAAFVPETDYHANLRYKEIELAAAGTRKLAELASQFPGLWRGQGRRRELVLRALVAREFFHRDKQYIIEGDKLVIVDEFTGRPMPQRTWREGLHQAIEAKEGLPISDPAETVARLSFQRFFRCFHQLSGMTGTAREAAGELWRVYHLPVIPIPTNRRCIRQHRPDQVFADEESKWRAVVIEIERLHSQGRPVLVGTRSVLASERLWQALNERGLQARVLNATRLKEEADIVALAGERGRIVIATNMAGRGTDIRLGHGVVALGGLHVLATERHESGRVDRQLFGRAARQGDPGSAQAFVSAEDELIRRYLPRPARAALNLAVHRRFRGWEAVAHTAFALAQTRAQNLAARQRQAVLRSDTWLEESLSFADGG
jgi:preprotein translocase subunit SecA